MQVQLVDGCYGRKSTGRLTIISHSQEAIATVDQKHNTREETAKEINAAHLLSASLCIVGHFCPVALICILLF